MNANSSSLHRPAGLLACAMLTLSCAHAVDATKDTDALPATADTNHISFGGEASAITGSSTAYQTRAQISKNPAGGIEDLNYSTDISKSTNVLVAGHALAGAEDYLGLFKVTKNEVGSFDIGYKRFRTFYDGAGGFFPLNNAWLPIYPRALSVDRGKLFIDATVSLPNLPVFTFRYSNETRTGRKDSTIWGDTDLTGITIYSQSARNPISSDRKILPAYIDLNERQQTWEASVKHTLGNTTGVLSVVGTRINNFDVRSVDRYIGELKPYPAIPSSPLTIIPNNLGNNPNYGFDQRGYKEDGLTVAGRVDTVVNDKITIYISGNHRHTDGDIADSRHITADTLTKMGVVPAIGAFTTGGRPPYSYDSSGKIKSDVTTGNIGAELKPLADLRLDVALKGEDYHTNGYNNAVYINTLVNQATGAVTSVPVSTVNGVKIDEKSWTPEIDARYSGIPHVTLFGTWDYRSAPGDERTSYIGISPSGNLIVPSPDNASEKVTENHRNLKLGANWAAVSFLSLRAEFYTKDHENNFTGYAENFGDYYNLEYDIKGAVFSGKLQLGPTVSFTTRYITQTGKALVQGGGYLLTDANESHRYQIDETVDWTPMKQFYMQANINVVYDTISTSYGNPLVTLTARNVVHDSNNNYWNGSVLAGFVVDKNTDAQVQATYYRADNYNPALAGSTMPYGAGGRDYSVTLGVKHKLTDRVITTGKIGYLNSNNELTGGFSDYKGVVGYVTVDYRL